MQKSTFLNFILMMVLISFSVWADKDLETNSLRLKLGGKELHFSGYLDGYYAYDPSNPLKGEQDIELHGVKSGRDYTSNPLYDRQFSLNYGFFQLELQHENVGFRMAYHIGDIVQKMYIDEPERLTDIREASAFFEFEDGSWLELGYMPSIFGFEGFISRDNMHATRSYMTDFAPDFDAGVRYYWKKSQKELLKLQITNGWQVLRDRNKEKAFGGAYVYTDPKIFMFNWGHFIGDESDVGVKTSYRYFSNMFAKVFFGDKWIVAPMLDLGWEQRLTEGHKKSWVPWQSWGASVRYALSDKYGIAARFDRTRDPNNIIPELKSTTGVMPHGWNSNGYTLTFEHLYNSFTTMRLEGRYVKSKDAVFKTRTQGRYIDEDSFLYSSVAMSF